MIDKRSIYQLCLEVVNQRLASCKNSLMTLQESLYAETKSSAGDKHETGRAMIQLEREQLGNQLAKIERDKEMLLKINPEKTSKTIVLGSCVQTSEHSYFISVGLGKIPWKENEWYAISLDAPIGQLLVGKKEGDKLFFREKEIEVLAVF